MVNVWSCQVLLVCRFSCVDAHLTGKKQADAKAWPLKSILKKGTCTLVGIGKQSQGRRKDGKRRETREVVCVSKLVIHYSTHAALIPPSSSPTYFSSALCSLNRTLRILLRYPHLTLLSVLVFLPSFQPLVWQLVKPPLWQLRMRLDLLIFL